MKKVLFISSIVIIIFLLAEAYRENISMDWRHYQKLYKVKIKEIAKSDLEKEIADRYPIKLRQFVLPELNRSDRCISCHVGLEDPRMADMPQPLTTHPGTYLEEHEVEKIGCTICHDGQGRALTSRDAKAYSLDTYWEKPMLEKPFGEANCYRCHRSKLEETDHYNQGKELFDTKGCMGCHRINGKGGAMGPDISSLGNANFHVKMPTHENREHLLDKFHENVNLAYIYEAVKEPRAQPENSQMLDYKFSEEDAINLSVFLKSLTTDIIYPHFIVAKEQEGSQGSRVAGEELFLKYCSACHSPDGEWIEKLPFGKSGPAITSADFLNVVGRKQLIRTIETGRENGKMPAWKSNLSEREINQIVDFIESKRTPAQPYDTVQSFLSPVEKGAAVFQEKCNICHLPSSAGSLARPLNHIDYLQGAEQKGYYEAIVNGDPARGMPAFPDLSKNELSGLLSLFRSWKSGKDQFAGEFKKLTGDRDRGGALFEENCALCHGPKGQSGEFVQIGSKEFINTVEEGFISSTLAIGRETSTMLPIKDLIDAKDDAEAAQYIADLTSYILWEEK